MERRNRFLIGLVAAALTFGALAAAFGPRHFQHRGHYGPHDNCCHWQQSQEQNQSQQQQQ